MSSILTSENIGPRKGSFWRHQFAPNRTEAQLIFDVAFGLIAPILCFYFDPIVFKRGLMGQAILQPYQLFAYAVTALEVTIFALWLSAGARLGAWSGLIGGVLISGSVFSAVIGAAILPYSVMGLIFVIGFLGFIPFVTAFVYLRVGWRAFRSEEGASSASWTNALLVGAILSLGIPALVSLYVSRTAAHSIDTILHGSPQQAQLAVSRLRWLPLIPAQNLEPIVQAYMVEKDSSRKEILRNSYQLLAGEDIDRRIAILND